jgi:flagellar hook protein FlgE
MSSALSAGVSGLKAFQQMLDVAGNNIANVETTAYKTSTIHFSQLLSETLKKASQPTANTGGTNPVQVGSGVGVSGIVANTTQGDITSTGNALDMALEGQGYFVLSDGSQNVFTRAGAFSVDEKCYLVDSATGYRVQRIGNYGEAEGFQIPGNSDLRVPYDVAMAASATKTVTVSGNLSSNATTTAGQKNVLTASNAFTINSGTSATGGTTLSALDQWTAGTTGAGTLTISGFNHDGDALTDTGLAVTGATTLDDIITHINTVLDAGGTAGANGTAKLVNGKITITDSESGYSLSDANISFASTDGTKLETSPYFEITTVGGDEVKSVSLTVYDNLGSAHVLSAALVRTNEANTWDMVLTSITGDISSITTDGRRISGIDFNKSDGSLAGLDTTIGDTSAFSISFATDPDNEQTIDVSMGTVGQLDGLTQFAGDSTAVASGQDGYTAGRLSSVSANNAGLLIGTFSNGVKKTIGAVEIALFQNPAGLEATGSNYFVTSANSGEAVYTQAMSGGAGTLQGSALEKSNADTATEFVNLITAQNGFQANTRTIKVASEILQELATLIT